MRTRYSRRELLIQSAKFGISIPLAHLAPASLMTGLQGESCILAAAPGLSSLCAMTHSLEDLQRANFDISEQANP